MVIHAKTNINRSPNSNTQYLTIPADMARDSEYPFKGREDVDLFVDESRQVLIARKGPKEEEPEEGWEEELEEVLESIGDFFERKLGL